MVQYAAGATMQEQKLIDDPRRPWANVFLTSFAENGNVTGSAKIAGVSRMAVWRARQDNEDFAKAYNDAKEQAADALEAEAWKRATEGTQEPVFYKGQECGAITRKSDTLLMFMLKGLRPEKYRERFTLSPGELDEAIRRELAIARGEELPESAETVN